MCSGYHGIYIFHVSHVLLPLHILCGKNHVVHFKHVQVRCVWIYLISKQKLKCYSNFSPGPEEEMDLQPERQGTQGSISDQLPLLV